MNHTQLYQFDPEELLQDEDDSNCFEKAESSKKVRGEPGTLTGVYANSVYSWPR